MFKVNSEMRKIKDVLENEIVFPNSEKWICSSFWCRPITKVFPSPEMKEKRETIFGVGLEMATVLLVLKVELQSVDEKKKGFWSRGFSFFNLHYVNHYVT